MPTDIVETPAMGTTLSVPVGTDKRKASSLTAAWQAIGNRLAFLEQFYNSMFGPGGSSGALVFQNNVDLTVAAGKTLKIQDTSSGTSTGVLDLSFIHVVLKGLTRGPLVRAAPSDPLNTGRVPKKVNGDAVPISVDATFDPTILDVILCNPSSAAINLDLVASPAEAFVDGDHFRVVNLNTTAGHTITVRTAALATLYVVDPASSSGHPCYVDMVYTTGFGWYVTGQNKVV